MNNEMENDGFFSERSYLAANELSSLIGRLLQAILDQREPDWEVALHEINKRVLALSMFGSNPPEYIQARYIGFFLLNVLVDAQEKRPERWQEVIELVRGHFPAFDALALMEEQPDYNREMAETFVYLRYRGENAA